MQVNLVLHKRKGFIKLALRHGAGLVPVFVFGETQLYRQSGVVAGLQDWVRNMIGIAPVIFYGQGFFQNSFGFLPRRSPMYVVVGEPIPVTRVAELGQEDIDRLHALYVKQMRKLQKYNPVSVYCKYFYKAIILIRPINDDIDRKIVLHNIRTILLDTKKCDMNF